jgi:hypothetical protein
VRGLDAASKQQDAHKEVTIARLAQDAWPGDVFLGRGKLSRTSKGAAMTQRSHVVAANEYRRVRWKNGAGWTREIVRVPDREDWDWRLSIAEIEQDAPFSVFPGIDRELTAEAVSCSPRMIACVSQASAR